MSLNVVTCHVKRGETHDTFQRLIQICQSDTESIVNAAIAIQNGTGLEDLVDFGGASAMHGCREQPRIQT